MGTLKTSSGNFFLIASTIFLRVIKAQASDRDQQIHRVAIVGGGIGGASAAHFLRSHEYFNDKKLEITLFEAQDVVGGRVRDVYVEGTRLEAGAAVYHDSNHYFHNFTKTLSLATITEDVSAGNVGLWDGDKMVWTYFGNPEGQLEDAGFLNWRLYYRKLANVLRIAARYNTSLFKVQSIVKTIIDKWMGVYKTGPDGHRTMEGFMQYLGLNTLVEQTALKYFVRQHSGMSLFVNEVLSAVNRINYGQSELTNAFVSSVSLAGVATVGKIMSVKDGNQRVPERLVSLSVNKVRLNQRVTAIRKSKKMSNKFVIISEAADGIRDDSGDFEQQDDDYDSVIIAAPFPQPPAVAIDLTEVLDPTVDLSSLYIPYQETIATWIVADRLSPEYFKFDAVGTFDMIFTPEYGDPQVPFSTLNTVSVGDDARRIYKVFSRRPLTERDIDRIFVNAKKARQIAWKAYPVYTPRPANALPPFMLAPGLYYANAMESVAAAMEISIVGAKNVVELLVEEAKANNAGGP